MNRRLATSLFVALFAAAPLAAQTTEPSTEPPPSEEAAPEIGERVDRSEEGMLRGTIVLIDGENLIVETDEGDRAFSIRSESELPVELRDADDWATARGLPVSVTFQPGVDGELRVVERVTLLPPTTVSTTLTTETAVEPMPETDLADQSDVVEPIEVAVTRVDPTTDTVETTMTTTTTDGQAIALANPDEPDAEADVTAAQLTDDDDPAATDTLASLPATASSLPLLALIGSLALLAALGLGRWEARRRRVTITDERR